MERLRCPPRQELVASSVSPLSNQAASLLGHLRDAPVGNTSVAHTEWPAVGAQFGTDEAVGREGAAAPLSPCLWAGLSHSGPQAILDLLGFGPHECITKCSAAVAAYQSTPEWNSLKQPCRSAPAAVPRSSERTGQGRTLARLASPGGGGQRPLALPSSEGLSGPRTELAAGVGSPLGAQLGRPLQYQWPLLHGGLRGVTWLP